MNKNDDSGPFAKLEDEQTRHEFPSQKNEIKTPQTKPESEPKFLKMFLNWTQWGFGYLLKRTREFGWTENDTTVNKNMITPDNNTLAVHSQDQMIEHWFTLQTFIDSAHCCAVFLTFLICTCLYGCYKYQICSSKEKLVHTFKRLASIINYSDLSDDADDSSSHFHEQDDHSD